MVEIRVLGELAVFVDGLPQPLPRSRKTRALLGYLAVTAREHRRDQLCDLFWDVTDDRRAALRWSLSKLRKTLASASECLVAAREHVALRLPPRALDLERLRALGRTDPAACPIDDLEWAVAGGPRELLEGLFLPDFDTFEAWLEAEREAVRRLHARFQPTYDERGTGDASRGPTEGLALVEEAFPPASSRPLVGRDGELTRFDGIVRQAALERVGRVVLLLGEPGMGKTRVLEEIQHRLRDRAPSVVSAAFFEAERHRPLAPFLDALRGALPELDTTDAELERQQLFEAIARRIRRGAEARGLGLLLLDDAHLGDPSSCELLHYIVRTAARAPLVTVVAARPAELAVNRPLSLTLSSLRRSRGVDEIRLLELDEEALRALVRWEAPGASERRVLRSCAGNPLIALEIARSGADDDETPLLFRELVLERLTKLSEGTRALVRWAAVLERGPLHMLERVCAGEVTNVLDALDEADRYGFVRLEASGAAFATAHELLQRAVYEDIGPLRRASMHRLVAEISSESDKTLDRSLVVVHHATRADRPDLAARFLVSAAESAAAIGALGEASALTDQALDLLPRLEARASVQLELRALVVLARVRRSDDPVRFVERLTQLGLSSLDLGRGDLARQAFHVASNLRWEAGSAHEGYGLARQAWHASRDGGEAARIQATSFMAMCLALMEKDLPDARALVHEAEARAHRAEGGPIPVELALTRGLLHLHSGRFDEARREATDARTLARLDKGPVFEALALELSSQLELIAGRPAAAAAAAAELSALSARMREGGEAASAAAIRALTCERIEEAREGLAQALERLELLDDKRRSAWVANRWARKEREAGATEAAERLARSALEKAEAVQAVSSAAMATCEIMTAALARGDDRAYAEAEEMLGDIEARGSLSFEARRLIDEVTGP